MSNISGEKFLELIHQEAQNVSQKGSTQQERRARLLIRMWEILSEAYPIGDASRDGQRGVWLVTDEIILTLKANFSRKSDSDIELAHTLSKALPTTLTFALRSGGEWDRNQIANYQANRLIGQGYQLVESPDVK